MVQWNAAVLDKFIAPGISTLLTADIRDVSGQFPQADYWLANHFLNSALGSRYRDGYRQVAVAFLRRAQDALASYNGARRLTLCYLEGVQPLNPSVRKYYAAVGAWEGFALQCGMAIDLFRWLNVGGGAFEKNDGSKEQRLYTMANQVKHTASCVQSGQCRPEDTIPLWLSNNGLESFGVSVSYGEASEVLGDVCRLADELQEPGGGAAPA